MQSKHIVLIALLQTGVLMFGILFTAAVIRIAERADTADLPQPLAYEGAVLFRDYGFFLFGFVVAWTFGASYFSFYPQARQVSGRSVIGSGIALALGFLALGGLMVGGATTPFWSL